MTMAFPESAGERIQRSLNDAKRNELSDRFGGVFLAGNMPLPADVESEFLQRIEEFELKWAAHDVTTVRAFIGDPPVKLSSEIAPDELQSELEHLMSTLDENDIQLDFAERPSDAEVYRFIVEELLDHEIDDIRVPGMVCHFIYEEFHPNASLDVRLACEWFVERMLSHDEHLLRSLERCEHAGADGNVFDFTDLRAAVADVHARIATVIDHSTAVIASDVGDCAACVDVEIRLKGFEAGSLNELNAEWKSRLSLLKDAIGDWIVVGLVMRAGF